MRDSDQYVHDLKRVKEMRRGSAAGVCPTDCQTTGLASCSHTTSSDRHQYARYVVFFDSPEMELILEGTSTGGSSPLDSSSPWPGSSPLAPLHNAQALLTNTQSTRLCCLPCNSINLRPISPPAPVAGRGRQLRILWTLSLCSRLIT